jgi:hypothetical protein
MGDSGGVGFWDSGVGFRIWGLGGRIYEDLGSGFRIDRGPNRKQLGHICLTASTYCVEKAPCMHALPTYKAPGPPRSAHALFTPHACSLIILLG